MSANDSRVFSQSMKNTRVFLDGVVLARKRIDLCSRRQLGTMSRKKKGSGQRGCEEEETSGSQDIYRI